MKTVLHGTTKRYFRANSIVIAVMTSSLLIEGCAVQPKKSSVPAPLEKEIRYIEGQNPTTIRKPPIPARNNPPAVSSWKPVQEEFSDGETVYIFKKGDTLWSISKSFGVSVEVILNANHIVNTKDLNVGQKLIIPTSKKTNLLIQPHSNYPPVRNTIDSVLYYSFIGLGRSSDYAGIRIPM